MKDIIFATGNKGKIISMQKRINKLGLSLNIIQCPLEITEIQADTSSEVAIEKGRQAFLQLKKPLLVDDSSFHISALCGFPGPYIKYMITTIGAEGIISIMEGKTDRSAYFLSSLVYVDESGEIHLFEDEKFWGTIANQTDNFDADHAWSDTYKIFIRDGSDKVLARMTDAERALTDKGLVDSYEKFCLWIKDKV